MFNKLSKSNDSTEGWDGCIALILAWVTLIPLGYIAVRTLQWLALTHFGIILDDGQALAIVITARFMFK